jgi:hypothetical protein
MSFAEKLWRGWFSRARKSTSDPSRFSISACADKHSFASLPSPLRASVPAHTVSETSALSVRVPTCGPVATSPS